MSVVSVRQNPASDELFRQVSKTAYRTAAVCLLLTPVALAIEFPLARLMIAGRLPGDLHRLVNFAEVFAHGLGVATLCLVVFVLDPVNRRSLPRIATCAFGAGLLANVVKLTVARQRPSAFFQQAEAATHGVSDTFCGFFPLFSRALPNPASHTIQSFPSAHTATAVAFAFALAWRYPRGRWLFASFAVMAGVQRLAVSAHFLSDVFVGAAVGAAFVGIGFDRRLAGRCVRLLLKRKLKSHQDESSGLRPAA